MLALVMALLFDGIVTGGLLKSAAVREQEHRPLQPAMDVFSLGCVIGEIFLSGQTLLDLPDVLQYRTAADPQTCLKRLNKVGSP